MSKLTVYDTQGKEYSPTGDATGTNQRIKDIALASLRIAVKPTERQVTGYFRAKETPNSRAEQFYGEYIDRNTAEPLSDFVNAVRTQIDEWNHTLEESDDSMAIFNALTNQRRATVPGSEKDIRILEELAGDREVTAVGVSGANEAVGLLQEFRPDDGSMEGGEAVAQTGACRRRNQLDHGIGANAQARVRAIKRRDTAKGLRA